MKKFKDIRLDPVEVEVKMKYVKGIPELCHAECEHLNTRHMNINGIECFGAHCLLFGQLSTTEPNAYRASGCRMLTTGETK